MRWFLDVANVVVGVLSLGSVGLLVAGLVMFGAGDNPDNQALAHVAGGVLLALGAAVGVPCVWWWLR